MNRLYVLANPTYDVIGGATRPGGPALYAALAARVLGFRVYAYGAVGRDGHSVVKAYVDRGVRFALLRFDLDSATTRFRIEYHGDERRMVVEEVGPVFDSSVSSSPLLISPVLREAPFWLLESVSKGAFLDIQGLVRVREKGPLRLEEDVCSKVPLSGLRGIHGDIGELEVCMASRGERLVSKLVELSREGIDVLASMGYRGLLLFTEGAIYHVAAWGPRASDPTGMGDVLTASFAYSVSRGLAALDAARVAVVVCGFHAERRYEETGLDGVLALAERIEARRLGVGEAVKLAYKS